MNKEQFLDIVKGFNREEFRQYLLDAPNRKRKLIQVITFFDDDGNPIDLEDL